MIRIYSHSYSSDTMSHKVHPVMYRIPFSADWSSRWFQLKKTKQFLEEDMYIREFLRKAFLKALVESIEIERYAKQVKIIVRAARPGIIIGRGGSGVEEVKQRLERFVIRKTRKKDAGVIKIEIHEVRKADSSAAIVGRMIAEQIERRLPFRRIMKSTLEKIMADKEVKGAKLEFSGRLGGSEIARREWLAKGQLPLTTLRAHIDYAKDEALCTYGKIGIKVWIYKGEKTEEKKI